MVRVRKIYQKKLLWLLWGCLAGVAPSAKKIYATVRPFARLTNTFGRRYASSLHYKYGYRGYVWPKRTYVGASFSRLCHLPVYYRGGYGSITWPYLLCIGFVLAERNLMEPRQAEDNAYKQLGNLNEMKFSPTDYEFAFLSNHVYKSAEELQKEQSKNKSQKKRGEEPTLAKGVNGKKEVLAGWAI